MLVSTNKVRVGFFAGSFDPFTRGHADIVFRALELFDEVVIGVGVHPSKRSFFSLDQRLLQIESVYQDDPRVRVVSYENLTIDAARAQGANFLIRGVRTASDFEYEKNLSQINDHLQGPTTILFFAAQNLLHVSSSMVREFLRLGRDVSEYIPEGMPIHFPAGNL